MNIKKIVIGIIIAVTLAGGAYAGIAVYNTQNKPDTPPVDEVAATPSPIPTPAPTPYPTPTPTPTPIPVYHDEDEWQDAYAQFLPGKKTELLEYIYDNVIGMWEEPMRDRDELGYIEDKLFMLYDLDRNGIPELLLINGEILTYKHGELKLFEQRADFWTYWHEDDDIDMYDVGIPDDGSNGLLVYDKTTYIEGQDVSEILMHISLEDDILEVYEIYIYDSAYDSYTRRVYHNAYDREGRLINPLQNKWLANRNTFTKTLDFIDITVENIQSVIYEYEMPDVVVPPVTSTPQELMYADVFDQMIDILGEFYNCNIEEVVNISDITYAFYDIDGNGTDELIITDGAGAFIYTLSDEGAAELVSFNGNRRTFAGINEQGYIHGGEIKGDYETADVFYEIDDDGISLINHSLSVNERDSENIRYSFETNGESQSITETQYKEYLESFKSSYIKLQWTRMTFKTGR